MRETTRKLLLIDGIVNLLLGLLLLLFPIGMAPILGVPISESNFYPTILGAVLFGIGIALLIDAYGQPHGIHGLGIEGAIAINFCGAGVLIVWLLFTSLNLPLRGYIVLWMIAIIATAIGSIELAIMSWKRRCSDKKRAINLNDCSRSG